MRTKALGVALATIALLSACSGAAEDPVEPVAEPTEEAVEPSAPADEETPEDGSEPTTAGPGDATVLLGTVGTPDDPEAFTISLTTQDGEPVTSLPAGEYTIEVIDPATMHNFHLTGGSVDETTTVADVEQATWDVTLEEGEYTYTCDPHPSMTGTFEVTA